MGSNQPQAKQSAHVIWWRVELKDIVSVPIGKESHSTKHAAWEARRERHKRL